MTPGARVQAAIEILDAVVAGAPAEKALTGWARRSRFAGSKDRAAVRDHVFDVLRRRASCGAAGGADGRGLMQGLLRLRGEDPGTLFTGEGHAPAPMTAAESQVPATGEVVDLPGWIVPRLRSDLGDDFERTAHALCERAPVMLRVNLRKCDRARAVTDLARDGIVAEPAQVADTALVVRVGARHVRNSAAYREGRVELQDGSSQAAVAEIDTAGATSVLDFCAGGGGKVLALAARHAARFVAHDANAGRMTDLPARASRAGVEVAIANRADLRAAAPFDLVLCDAPCSGSGTWRRTPDAKWRFTRDNLEALLGVQDAILDEAAALAGPRGRIAYMTCSLLRDENDARVSAFLARTAGWRLLEECRWPVGDIGDGFFLAQIVRD